MPLCKNVSHRRYHLCSKGTPFDNDLGIGEYLYFDKNMIFLVKNKLKDMPFGKIMEEIK